MQALLLHEGSRSGLGTALCSLACSSLIDASHRLELEQAEVTDVEYLVALLLACFSVPSDGCTEGGAMLLFFQQLDMADLKKVHAWTAASTHQSSSSGRKQLVDALMSHMSQVTFCLESYVQPMPSSAYIMSDLDLALCIDACSAN